MSEKKKGAGKSERLFTGLALTIIGLLGLGYGGMGGMMGGMMGYGYGYGCGYSPLFLLIPLVFLGITIFGLYIIYDSLKE